MLHTVLSLLSQIYCSGPILRTVQDSMMFADSKHFVDMTLKMDPVTTLRDFDRLGTNANDFNILKRYVETHFDEPGSELIEWIPEDWVEFPSSFLRIHDYHHRRWALHLHRIWKELCRRVKDDVRVHQSQYSLLYVPHPFIIPGGRFREFYYWYLVNVATRHGQSENIDLDVLSSTTWGSDKPSVVKNRTSKDSFWILKGLLFSEMPETARGVIRNLAYMVDNHGFVPNGGRVYYLTRSQPPLLIPMVFDYYLATGDIDFIMEMVPTLEKEYLFWIKNRQFWHVNNQGGKLFPYYQYRANMKMPRPESYREDNHLVHGVSNVSEKYRIWTDIASAAETGWDFSTRWFSQTGDERHSMKTIKTTRIVPVDLNAFMCINARVLASLYEVIGDKKKVAEYWKRYSWAKQEMKALHWNETDGVWYDYDLDTKSHVNVYYVSNAVPLWAKCYDDEDAITPHRVHDYFKREGVLNFTKGVPTSLAMASEQQWDKENAWPPMVHIVIEGFRETGDPQLMKVAEKMATSWLSNTYHNFIRTRAMFEKYNVTQMTEEACAGSGGEYEVQKGFGWTNGVILDLLDKYGDKLNVYPAGLPSTLSLTTSASRIVQLSAIALFALISCLW